MRTTLSVLGLISYLAIAPLAEAGARLIVSLRVGPTLATHAIPVRNCAQDLTHVKLDVLGSSIWVEQLGVRMNDGRVLAQRMDKSFPVGAGQWTDISPARGLGCIVQVFAVARSETRYAARIKAYGMFQ